MSKGQLIAELMACAAGGDKEGDHILADSLLLKFIADPEVTEAFDAIGKWYA